MYNAKEHVRCMMVTGPWRIEGDVHVLSGSRLTDTLNSKANDFLAVTEATVYDIESGKQLFRPPYIAVNRTTISAVFPIE